MTRTVVALYDNFEDANAAVRELVDSGFTRDDISLMAGDEQGTYGQYLESDTYHSEGMNKETDGASSGAGVGAGIGATLGGIGGLLVGLGALVIPGIGPVIAAGPLSAALAGLAGAGAGALAGGITGGLIGALVDVGVPEETAQYYSEGVRRGGTLLTIRTEDDMSSRAVSVMNRHNPVDINSRASEWRSQGWAGFQSDARHSDVSADTEMHHDHEHDHIPNTGDGDTAFGSGGAAGTNFGGVSGQNYGQGSYGSETDSRREFDQGSSYGTSHETGRDFDQGGGAMGHSDSVARGENTSLGGLTGRDYNTTGGDMPSTGSDYRSADQGLHGTMDSDFGRGQFRDYGSYDTSFHDHFNTLYGVTGGSYQYDQYQPAYRYGYDLAVNPQYTGRSWMDVEPEARQYWEDREPGAWERFKDAVQHAWHEVRDRID